MTRSFSEGWVGSCVAKYLTSYRVAAFPYFPPWPTSSLLFSEWWWFLCLFKPLAACKLSMNVHAFKPLLKWLCCQSAHNCLSAREWNAEREGEREKSYYRIKVCINVWLHHVWLAACQTQCQYDATLSVIHNYQAREENGISGQHILLSCGLLCLLYDF